MTQKSSKRRKMRWLFAPALIVLGLGGLCLLALIAYQLPPVHARLSWRVANLQAEVQRFLNPPEELVFVPQGGAGDPAGGSVGNPVATSVQATLTQMGVAPDIAPETPPAPAEVIDPPALLLETVAPAATSTTLLPTVTPTPTLQPTPLPHQVRLSGVIHEYQQFNNCGPANLAMTLSFWGWQGDQRDTRKFLRPNLDVDDKNVMPAEMVAYVEGFTQLKAMTRVGGDLDLLRSLLAAGFPVLIEAGHDPADDWWMGHYLVVSGYDDALQILTVQDSLTNPDLPMSYAELAGGYWRDFNYVYVIVYPAEREAELSALLGARLDAAESYRLAERRALQEIETLSGRDQFFAWFNLGSSRVGLQDYAGAAQAYDQAFALYQGLSEDMRPYRLMWYQDGAYAAYYYAGRYQDVVSLANTTFGWVGKPVLEESYYWRGMAELALGQTNQAASDFQKAAALNPNYAPPRDELAKLGLTAP